MREAKTQLPKFVGSASRTATNSLIQEMLERWNSTELTVTAHDKALPNIPLILYELRDSVVMSPFRVVSVEASDIDPASDEDMICDVSPFVVAELFPDDVLRCLG